MPCAVRHRGAGDRRRVQRGLRPHRARRGSIAFASPKSSTLTVPSARTLMFAGLRSRWMMPCSCAASSAWRSASRCQCLVQRHRVRARCAATRSSPSTSSITSALIAAGFFETVDVRDVRSGSARRGSGLRARSAPADRDRRRRRRGRTLSATSRSSRVSRARIHLAHAAFPNPADDFVDPETGARGERHRVATSSARL